MERVGGKPLWEGKSIDNAPISDETIQKRIASYKKQDKQAGRNVCELSIQDVSVGLNKTPINLSAHLPVFPQSLTLNCKNLTAIFPTAFLNAIFPIIFLTHFFHFHLDFLFRLFLAFLLCSFIE